MVNWKSQFSALGVALSFLTFVQPLSAAEKHAWVTTFASSPANFVMNIPTPLPKEFENIGPVLEKLKPIGPLAGTFRFRFGTTIAGSSVRVRISNELGEEPLRIESASIALAGQGMGARAGSVAPLTFGGKKAITIPAGAPMLSDPITMPIPPFAELLVTTYLPEPIILFPLGSNTIEAAPGNQSMAEVLTDAKSLKGRPIVTAVEVKPLRQSSVIVAFGDSITDGSRPDPMVAHGWANVLAHRLAARTQGPSFAIANAGISGNRLLWSGAGPTALARFDRDVLAVPGVSHVIMLLGINDIGMGGNSFFGNQPVIQADDLIAAYHQIIERSHLRGLKIIGATLLPFHGSRGYNEDNERIRQTVNSWIRESKQFDGIIDFDAATRDSMQPKALRPEFDPGDHLHPNDAGYRAMGDAIDLRLFKR